MYGRGARPSPVRLTAHALDMTAPKVVRWRFLDARGQQLLRGTLQMSDAYDPFTGVLVDQEPAELGLASRTFLVPPAGTQVLELSAPSALVEVDALLEKGAQAEPLPPFDVPLGSTLRWQDAPVPERALGHAAPPYHPERQAPAFREALAHAPDRAHRPVTAGSLAVRNAAGKRQDKADPGGCAEPDRR